MVQKRAIQKDWLLILPPKAKQKHIHAKVVGMDQYRLTDLPKEEYLLAVISTHGEGEPPVAAKKFYDHIHQNGFKLEKLKYSVWHWAILLIRCIVKQEKR